MGWQVYCGACGACGQSRKDKHLAVVSWNKVALPHLPRPTVWEYLVVRRDVDTDDLQRLGQQGWELVVLQAGSGRHITGLCAIFKRKVA
jgi:hypothetical protein